MLRICKYSQNNLSFVRFSFSGERPAGSLAWVAPPTVARWLLLTDHRSLLLNGRPFGVLIESELAWQVGNSRGCVNGIRTWRNPNAINQRASYATFFAWRIARRPRNTNCTKSSLLRLLNDQSTAKERRRFYRNAVKVISIEILFLNHRHVF